MILLDADDYTSLAMSASYVLPELSNRTALLSGEYINVDYLIASVDRAAMLLEIIVAVAIVHLAEQLIYPWFCRISYVSAKLPKLLVVVELRLDILL